MDALNLSDSDVGVVVGRFQVDELHFGHRFLIESVLAKHRDVLVAIGVSGGLPSKRDPLDYETRRRIILGSYPKVNVRPIYDCPSDEEWSKNLDRLVKKVFSGRKAVCYGSRGSFLEVYSGDSHHEFIEEVAGFSGTTARWKISLAAVDSKDFRAGAIYAASSRFPVSYQAVDIAVVSFDRGEILLGRKERDGGKLRFIGGFVDPSDESLERAVRRELFEEAPNIEISDLRYLGSRRIDDFRYRGSDDGIMSALFISAFIFGSARAGDDLDALVWIPLRDARQSLTAEHLTLLDIIENNLNQSVIKKGELP